MTLRSEFMLLVDMMAGATKDQACMELPTVMKELDTNVKGYWSQPMKSPQHNLREAERVGTDIMKPRHCSQPPSANSGRRPTGSPQVHRNTGTFTTPRPGGPAGRARGTHQRSGQSAGAAIRQR
jgi:hypothetical protein